MNEPRPPRQPWHFDAWHAGWLLAGVAGVVLGIVLIRQWDQGLGLKSDYDAASAAVAASKSQNARLSADAAGFQEMIDRTTSRKEELVREIADFQNQLDLLSAKVRGLELVKADLEKLQADLGRYREVEDRFKSHLQRLEGSSPQAPTP